MLAALQHRLTAKKLELKPKHLRLFDLLLQALNLHLGSIDISPGRDLPSVITTSKHLN
jgi:hypothetical protein